VLFLLGVVFAWCCYCFCLINSICVLINFAVSAYTLVMLYLSNGVGRKIFMGEGANGKNKTEK